VNRFCLTIVLVCALSAGPAARRASADERTGIRLWNIGGQAGMTLGQRTIPADQRLGFIDPQA